MGVTREVLGRHGYEVVRTENRGQDIVVWYRQRSRGRGRNRAPLVRMVIRRDADRVVFLEAPNPILLDLDVRLRF